MIKKQTTLPKGQEMKTGVTEFPTAKSNEALKHFENIMAFETDCWDVHESQRSGSPDYVLLDVRSPTMYAAGHIQGAINLPHGKIIPRKLSDWAKDTIFVVYCAGPHCNGATRAAIRFSKLDRPVKSMPGGITGWIDEGFALAIGSEPSSVEKEERNK